MVSHPVFDAARGHTYPLIVHKLKKTLYSYQFICCEQYKLWTTDVGLNTRVTFFPLELFFSMQLCQTTNTNDTHHLKKKLIAAQHLENIS